MVINNKPSDMKKDNRLSWTPGDDQRPLHISPGRQQMRLDDETSTRSVHEADYDSSCCSTLVGACSLQPAKWFTGQPSQPWPHPQPRRQIEQLECTNQSRTWDVLRQENTAAAVGLVQVEVDDEEVNPYDRIGLAYGDREDVASHPQLGQPCHSLNTPISRENMSSMFIDHGALRKDITHGQLVGLVDSPQTRSNPQSNELALRQFYAQGMNAPLPASLTAGIAMNQEQHRKEALGLPPRNRLLRDAQINPTVAQGIESHPPFRFISNTGAEPLTDGANSDIDLINAGHNIQATSGLSQTELHMEITPPHDRISPSTTYTPAPVSETLELWLGPLPDLVSSSHSPAGSYQSHTDSHPHVGSREGAQSFQGDDRHEKHQIPRMNGSWRERTKQGWRRLIKCLNEPIVPAS